jgi:hypothetical protein
MIPDATARRCVSITVRVTIRALEETAALVARRPNVTILRSHVNTTHLPTTPCTCAKMVPPCTAT